VSVRACPSEPSILSVFFGFRSFRGQVKVRSEQCQNPSPETKSIKAPPSSAECVQQGKGLRRGIFDFRIARAVAAIIDCARATPKTRLIKKPPLRSSEMVQQSRGLSPRSIGKPGLRVQSLQSSLSAHLGPSDLPNPGSPPRSLPHMTLPE